MDDRELTVKRWLVKAEHDIETARVMLERDTPVPDVVCYHAQQCAEKCLKAFLVSRDKDFPKTHDLEFLLNLCAEEDDDFLELEESAVGLSDYAVETRYPDDWREIEVSEATDALRNASRFIKLTFQKLQ